MTYTIEPTIGRVRHTLEVRAEGPAWRVFHRVTGRPVADLPDRSASLFPTPLERCVVTCLARVAVANLVAQIGPEEFNKRFSQAQSSLPF